MRRQEQEGITEEQAQKTNQNCGDQEKDFVSTKFGPWMVAKKTYRRNNGLRAEGGLNLKSKVASQKGNMKAKQNIGTRFYLLDEDVSAPSDNEIIPESLEHVVLETVKLAAKKNKEVMRNEEELKKSLQAFASIRAITFVN